MKNQFTTSPWKSKYHEQSPDTYAFKLGCTCSESKINDRFIPCIINSMKFAMTDSASDNNES